MDTDFETFKKILSNNNKEISRIVFTNNIDNKDKRITGLQTFDENKINKVLNNFVTTKPLLIKFNRKLYYSQIKDGDNVYTEDYYLISNFKTKNNKYDVIIANYKYNIQEYNSFPNLNKYHHTESIVQQIYKIYGLNKTHVIIIIENNKIIIELTDYSLDILNKVYILINQLLED